MSRSLLDGTSCLLLFFLLFIFYLSVFRLMCCLLVYFLQSSVLHLLQSFACLALCTALLIVWFMSNCSSPETLVCRHLSLPHFSINLHALFVTHGLCEKKIHPSFSLSPLLSPPSLAMYPHAACFCLLLPENVSSLKRLVNENVSSLNRLVKLRSNDNKISRWRDQTEEEDGTDIASFSLRP